MTSWRLVTGIGFITGTQLAASVPPLLRVIEIAIAHGVQSVLVETRYIDADWRSEHARFYTTTYTRYPSVAHRAHFFTRPLPSDLSDLSGLTDAYRGYSVLRPLPVQPVGRTMIEPLRSSLTECVARLFEFVDILGWRMLFEGCRLLARTLNICGALIPTCGWCFATRTKAPARSKASRAGSRRNHGWSCCWPPTAVRRSVCFPNDGRMAALGLSRRCFHYRNRWQIVLRKEV